MKVTQDPISVDQLLTKYEKLIVPRYQREYSWDNQQLSDMFNDIADSPIESGHFFGSLLLYCEDEGKPAEIIDGQQRITTFFLLLNAVKNHLEENIAKYKLDKELHKIINRAIEKINNCIFSVSKKLLVSENNDIPRLETGRRDNKLFSEIIKGRNHKNVIDKSISSHKLILKASQVYFTKQLNELNDSEGVKAVIGYLDKIFASKFIVMTAEKNSDKVLLFKTLNARGLVLAQSDLIKNEICKAVKDSDIDSSIDTWDEIKRIIERANGNIETFLFHYLNSIYESNSLRSELESRRGGNSKVLYAPVVPEKYVFEIFELLLKDNSSIPQMLNKIQKYAEVYVEFISPNRKDKAYDNLVGLKALNITKCYPLLLCGKEILNERDFVKLVNAIEVVSFRHSVLKEDPKELEKLYYKVLLLLNETSNIDECLQMIKAHPTIKRTTDFNDAFMKYSPKLITSKYLLYRITRQNQEAIEWEAKDIHLEHVMPQKPSGNWLKMKNTDEDKYDEYLNRIGNLTLLNDKLNIGASNKEFKTKKSEYYTRSRLFVTKEYFKNYSTWDYSKIEQRQKDILAEVNKIWKV